MHPSRHWIRPSAVAGQFYPGSPAALEATVKRLLWPHEREAALAVIAPHAGFLYSGATAGRVFSRVRVPDRVVIACPNHTGWGAPLAVWPEGAWEIPGAAIPVDEELASAIMAEDNRFQADRQAHLMEHAVEVELPFLRALNPAVRIVPITIGSFPRESLIELGMALAHVAWDRSEDREILFVASTDMSHYVPAAEAERCDRMALDRIEALDPRGLYDTCHEQAISMCGVAPTTMVLTAAVELHATSARIVDYTHSGMVTGDDRKVVGYAGAIVS
ncbi:MAG: AmmeMemoRadiSam system protein B [Bradymonadales bacterium]|nr:AmmeMemoRadiSam system protein B [Bradymonadales bacterium]